MNDWIRLSVIRYVKDVAAYEERIRAGIERGKAIRAQMEGVGAVRYDREGSRPTGWEDRKPESLVLLEEIAAKLDEDIVLWAEQADAAHRLFDTCEETRMVWEHWGLRWKWAKVAARHCYNRDWVRRVANRGIEIIWHEMPEEYRRSPYPAQPWK